MSAPTESTYLVWYCRHCDRACKVQPPTIEPGCRCENPVPGLRPTKVTQMHRPKVRPMQALTDEEARLRGLARKGQRVRVTYEAEVTDAWLMTGMDGVTRVKFIVATPDGRSHVVDPRLSGLHVEAAAGEGDAEVMT